MKKQRRAHRATGERPGLASRNYDPHRAAEVRAAGGATVGPTSPTKFDTLRGRAARRRALLRAGYAPVVPGAGEGAPSEPVDPNFLDEPVDEEE